MPNGNLVFPPFRAEDYRQEVHAQVYACLAKNQVGSIISRDVHVRAGKLNASRQLQWGKAGENLFGGKWKLREKGDEWEKIQWRWKVKVGGKVHGCVQKKLKSARFEQ